MFEGTVIGASEFLGESAANAPEVGGAEVLNKGLKRESGRKTTASKPRPVRRLKLGKAWNEPNFCKTSTRLLVKVSHFVLEHHLKAPDPHLPLPEIRRCPLWSLRPTGSHFVHQALNSSAVAHRALEEFGTREIHREDRDPHGTKLGMDQTGRLASSTNQWVSGYRWVSSREHFIFEDGHDMTRFELGFVRTSMDVMGQMSRCPVTSDISRLALPSTRLEEAVQFAFSSWRHRQLLSSEFRDRHVYRSLGASKPDGVSQMVFQFETTQRYTQISQKTITCGASSDLRVLEMEVAKMGSRSACSRRMWPNHSFSLLEDQQGLTYSCGCWISRCHAGVLPAKQQQIILDHKTTPTRTPHW